MSTNLSATPSQSQHEDGTTVPSFQILLLTSNPEHKSLEVEFNSMPMKIRILDIILLMLQNLHCVLPLRRSILPGR